MADFNYAGTGGISMFGCAKATVSVFYNYAFGEGSIVFLKYKANKGILERIAIKKVIVKKNRHTMGQPVFLYQDSLNAYYNESELVSHQDAVNLAIAYHERQRAEALAAAKACL